MKQGVLKTVIALFASALLMQGCTISYKLNQASIDYTTTKTFSV